MATGIQFFGFQKHLSQTLFKYNYFIIIYEQFYILYLNLEYSISRKFIWIVIQTVFVPAGLLICSVFSLRLLSSSWLEILLLHKAARNSPSNEWLIANNVYTNNYSFGSSFITFIYNDNNHLFINSLQLFSSATLN